MSAKWDQARAWDEQFFPRWAWPFKATLRLFSSIPLAVTFLTLVLLYGVVASVPIGLLALIPTYLLYGATALVMIAVIAGLPILFLRRTLRDKPATRFTISFLGGVALTLAAIVLWIKAVWPALVWDEATHTGLRLFASFCDQYKSTTLRRLPAFEMTEPAFYAWWPLRLILLLFVINMIVATVRRIEFSIPNLGVLTVHTGIVTLALGSMHYQSLKQEGDLLLIAGDSDSAAPGALVSRFYDREKPALFIRQSEQGWTQIPIRHLPRYNDYGLTGDDRTLDLPVLPAPGAQIDPDVHVSIVGFSSYAELESGWESRQTPAPGEMDSPLVDVELLSSLGDEAPGAPPRVVASIRLATASPTQRTITIAGALGIESVPVQDQQRWKLLSTPFPKQGRHALVISLPGDSLNADNADGESITAVVEEGDVVKLGGYSVEVEQLLTSPPFPIITAGYEDADSSVAIVRITSPTGETYERYVYHRFPEINQDILGSRSDGRPIRRDADPAIQIAYLDATFVQVYMMEGAGVIVRQPGGAVEVIPESSSADSIPVAPAANLRIAGRFEHGHQREHPHPVPVERRQRDQIGTYAAAAINVQVSLPTGFQTSVWMPFTKYLGLDPELGRSVALPDGRRLDLQFSRVVHELPGFALQLVDFEMIPYPHSDIPRDYVSLVRVTDLFTGESREHRSRLNRPLIQRVAFRPSSDRSRLANALGRLISVVTPNRYKFSQAGWDLDGWRRTKALADAGQLDRPRAAFTILGVGNNPGIHVIAAGGVMMSIGIPWAFYVKPWIMRRRKLRIQRDLAKKSRQAKSPRKASRLASRKPQEVGNRT